MKRKRKRSSTVRKPSYQLIVGGGHGISIYDVMKNELVDDLVCPHDVSLCAHVVII